MAEIINMGEKPEILKLDEGKYSFFVGRQKYTLNTPIEEEQIYRVVSCIQELVAAFPGNLSQDERLFLALISLSLKLDEFGCRIKDLSGKISVNKE